MIAVLGIDLASARWTFNRVSPQSVRVDHLLCAGVDALLAQQGVRIADAPAMKADSEADAAAAAALGAVRDVGDGYVVLECFPTSIWRASGLTPLPAKAKKPDLQEHYRALAAAFSLPPAQMTSHDDLQAIVAALSRRHACARPLVL